MEEPTAEDEAEAAEATEQELADVGDLEAGRRSGVFGAVEDEPEAEACVAQCGQGHRCKYVCVIGTPITEGLPVTSEIVRRADVGEVFVAREEGTFHVCEKGITRVHVEEGFITMAGNGSPPKMYLNVVAVENGTDAAAAAGGEGLRAPIPSAQERDKVSPSPAPLVV